MSAHEAKLQAAKSYLGNRWIGHPEYQYSPRHSNFPHIYIPARQPYLRAVAEAAKSHHN